jgi:pimeloyl-ACP methyl ester carboxylesterase
VLWDEINIFSGKTIDVLAFYIASGNEWAAYHRPGAFEGMGRVCTQLRGSQFVPHAGHSVVEEKPDEVNKLLLEFLGSA